MAPSGLFSWLPLWSSPLLLFSLQVPLFLPAHRVTTSRSACASASRTRLNVPSISLRNSWEFGADLISTNLRGANLSRACLYDSDLRGADLRDANLHDADLIGAWLRDANLRGADLSEAHLQDSDLSEAWLRDTNLRGAWLRGADLRGADLSEAQLKQIKSLKGTIMPDGSVHP